MLCAALVLLACGSERDLIIGREATAGTAGNAGAGEAGATGGSAGFALLVHDDFDVLDETRWERAQHTFDENLADFVAGNAVVGGGTLRLLIAQKPLGSAGKSYAAAELRTREAFMYGKFVARARFASGPGILTTMFSFHDFFVVNAPAAWNEIVLEGSGAATPLLRFSASFPDPALPDAHGTYAAVTEAAFDPAGAFHDYAFEWTPGGVRFLIDGSERYRLPTEAAGLETLPQRFVISAYPSSAAWAGAFSDASVPAVAEYDWVELHTYMP